MKSCLDVVWLASAVDGSCTHQKFTRDSPVLHRRLTKASQKEASSWIQEKNLNPMADKNVNVRMSHEYHSAFKAYCALIGKTMGEVIYDWVRQELQHQSLDSPLLKDLLKAHNIKTEQRATKPCWGYRCNFCEHEKACRVGRSQKTFVPNQQWNAMHERECIIYDFNPGDMPDRQCLVTPTTSPFHHSPEIHQRLSCSAPKAHQGVTERSVILESREKPESHG